MMTNTARTLFLVGCVFLGVGANAFTAEEAHRLYDERFSKSPPSVQECGSYLFVIVEGAIVKDRHGDSTEQILSAQMDALEKYIGYGMFGVVSPFGEKLTARLSQKGFFEISSCPAVTVESSSSKGRFREVLALDAVPIKAERDRMSQKKPSRRAIGAWRKDLNALIFKCATEAMRNRLLAEAGLFIPLLLGREHTMPCVDVLVDGDVIENLFRQWDGNRRIHGKEDCESALDILPSFSPAHRRLAELAAEKGDWVLSVDEWMRAEVAGEADEKAVEFAFETLAVQSGDDTWRELMELRRMCRNCEVCGHVESTGTKRIRNCVRRSLGRIRFGYRDDAIARRFFSDASALYRNGTDLPQIVRLLGDSVERNPGDAEAWRLYGDALRTAKQWNAAVLAYPQALTFNAGDGEAVCDSARYYEALGFKKLAASAAWWAMLTSDDDATIKCSESILKRIYPHVFL